MRVLVVDDDPTVRTIVCRILSRHLDVDLTGCDNGLAALEALSTERFSLVLLDIEMPALDGHQVLRAIRESPTLHHLPVVMMTQQNDVQCVTEAVGAGVTAYILKPVRPRDLCDRVAPILAAVRSSEASAQQARKVFEPLRLGPTTELLVVDGDPEFRQFCLKTIGKLCPVTAVASGLEALKLCRDQPPYAIFVGSDIGLITAPMLARNLRSTRRLDEIRMVGIQPPRLVLRARKESHYEAVIMRSFVPEVFMEGVGALRYRPGRLSGLLASIPDLKLLGIAASEEALSTLLGKHLVLRPGAARTKASRLATAAMTLHVGDESLPLLIELSVPQRNLAKVAEQLCAGGTTVAPDTALWPLLQQVSQVLGRELHSRGLAVRTGEPFNVQPPPHAPGRPAAAGEMAAMTFDVEGAGVSFVLALSAAGEDRPLRTTAAAIPVL